MTVVAVGMVVEIRTGPHLGAPRWRPACVFEVDARSGGMLVRLLGPEDIGELVCVPLDGCDLWWRLLERHRGACCLCGYSGRVWCGCSVLDGGSHCGHWWGGESAG
jgi:hypothetical protein